MSLKYEKYVGGKKASEIIGISQATLRKWDAEGKIATIRTPAGRKRLYAVEAFIKDSGGSSAPALEKERICYCRVSSAKQGDDLERQVAEMRQRYPSHLIIQDIGSGINWKRKGFISLLQRVFAGTVKRVVVAHRDRLCRFGFELLEFIFKYHGVELVVSDEDCGEKDETVELAEDLLAIIHIFNCKAMGRRRYRAREDGEEEPDCGEEERKKQVREKPKKRPYTRRKGKDSSNPPTAEDTEKMDGNCSTNIQQDDIHPQEERS